MMKIIYLWDSCLWSSTPRHVYPLSLLYIIYFIRHDDIFYISSLQKKPYLYEYYRKYLGCSSWSFYWCNTSLLSSTSSSLWQQQCFDGFYSINGCNTLMISLIYKSKHIIIDTMKSRTCWLESIHSLPKMSSSTTMES